MRRDGDGYNENDLLRYCGSLIGKPQAPRRGLDFYTSAAEQRERRELAVRIGGRMGAVGEAELVEALLDADDGEISHIARIPAHEVRRRVEQRIIDRQHQMADSQAVLERETQKAKSYPPGWYWIGRAQSPKNNYF
jgi:hypothetical protein